MNISDFDQLNWDIEIKCPLLKTEKVKINRLSMSLKIWTLISGTLEKGLSGESVLDENGKSNSMRMYQYFLAKYIYNHSIFYKKKIEEDLWNPIKSIKDKYNLHNLKISKCPLSRIKDIEKIFIEKVKNDEAENKSKDGGYNEIKEYFKSENIKVFKPKGLKREGDRDTVAIKYDGLRYHISVMKGDYNKRKEYALEKIKHHHINIPLYHSLVKKVYNKLQKRGIKDLWVMEGGVSQVQMFFGDKEGYLGILYLDIRDEEELMDDYYIVPQRKGMKIFKNFKIEGIKIDKY